MAPISKPISTGHWGRKPSIAGDYRYVSALNSDGNSSNYSSGEENTRVDKKTIPSFMLNDELNGRSYVDPWDMENYSFLRRQLEDISLSDNELSSTPAFESTQSDFYYVPLDNNGSPQYQYKHYVDNSVYNKDRIASPIIFRDDSYGLVANIDEHDFYNEYLDTPHPSLSGPESYLEINNPSRQSERSRYNNIDYQTYTPPSIVKDIPELYNPDPRPYRKHYNTGRKPSRRSVSDLQLNHINLEEIYGNPIDYVEEPRNNKRFLDLEARENRRKSLADVKIKLNRRKSFHELSQPIQPEPETRTLKIEKRRKSALDRPQERSYEIGIPEKTRTKEKISRRKSMIEIASDLTKIGKNFRTHKFPRKSILQAAENFENVQMKEPIRDPYEYSQPTTLPRPYLSIVPDSSLVYVYETAKRRRKMVLPNPNMDVYGTRDYRCNGSDIEDAFSMDPIENYMTNRPTSRYMMSNYGHLKIDYSCSWNCLDRYIAHRVRT